MSTTFAVSRSSSEVVSRRQMSMIPHHLGIIPDGNRRFARKVGMSVEESYLAAADKALDAVEWCVGAGVGHLSAFGVSQENICRRPVDEVRWLHAALLRFCHGVQKHAGADLHLFGQPNDLPSFVEERRELTQMSADVAASSNMQMLVHVGVNYSGQGELATLLLAVKEHGLARVEASPEKFSLSAGLPPVDLVVRTGGQQRLSGFLPIQTAYSELWFTSTNWPEFEFEHFCDALNWYARQERRFGE